MVPCHKPSGASARRVPYLEVVLEPVLTRCLGVPAGGEVVAHLAGGVGAVGRELSAERVVQGAGGVSHDACAC